MSRKIYLDILTTIVGCMLVGSGLYGVFAPAEMSKIFGIMDANRDTLAYYPGIGGRNFAAGLATWWMTFAGYRKPLGIFLTCWITVGLADVYLMSIYFGEVENFGTHIFNICLLSVLGPVLLMS